MVRSNDGPDTGLYLIPRGLAGDEAEQVKDISQSYSGSDFGEVNARHDCAPGVRHRLIAYVRMRISNELGWRWGQRRGTRNLIC